MLHRRQPRDMGALNALAMQELESPPQPRTRWVTSWRSESGGGYEEEWFEGRPTGWYRCIGGRLANYLWPNWHSNTGVVRHSI